MVPRIIEDDGTVKLWWVIVPRMVKDLSVILRWVVIQDDETAR